MRQYEYQFYENKLLQTPWNEIHRIYNLRGLKMDFEEILMDPWEYETTFEFPVSDHAAKMLEG